MKPIQFITIVFLVVNLFGCHSHQDKSNAVLSHSKNERPFSVSSNPINLTERNPLLLSKDYGQTWINVSEGLPAEIEVSFIEQMEEEIVMATDNMGLFRSSESRTKWQSINAGLPNQKINALHISDESMYVGVYRAGIFKSIDKGEHWVSINYDLSNLSVQAIWEMEGILFAGTDDGIFKLLEKEKKWKHLDLHAQVLSIYSFEEKLVLGTSQGTAYSLDKGANWNWIRKKGAVHYTHNIASRIVELGLNGDLFFSDDWGENWVESSYEPRAGSYIYEVVEVNNNYILSNNYGIHRSIDKGKTWKHIYKTESMGFFDFLVLNQEIYGGTRTWDEYRKRK